MVFGLATSRLAADRCSNAESVFLCVLLCIRTWTLQKQGYLIIFGGCALWRCGIKYTKKIDHKYEIIVCYFCALCLYAPLSVRSHNSIVLCSMCISQIIKFMGPTWGPPGSWRSQMGCMLAPWTLLSGWVLMKSHNLLIRFSWRTYIPDLNSIPIISYCST